MNYIDTITAVITSLAPLVIEIIIIVSLLNFFKLLKNMISGIEKNVFLIAQQQIKIENKLNEIEQELKRTN